MNPLNSNISLNTQNIFNQTQFNQLNNMDQLMNNIRNVKEVMKMANGDLSILIQKFPSLGPVLQMSQGPNLQKLQSMFMSMCRARGIDPNVILNELRN